ncbi:serine hydrolase [Candidatus Parcubacteria bacterium]|nr:serine hydrolase [Candidatus Parcubacteria bacterium]
MKKIKNLLLIVFFLILAISFTSQKDWFFSCAIAETKPANKGYNLHLDEPTIAKGYTVNGFDELKLSLVPGILSKGTAVEIIQLNEDLPEPWNLDRVSNFYQFEFKNKAAYDDHKPFYIQFHYSDQTNDHKQVFFYDQTVKAWRPLPTRDFPKENFVRSLIHLPYARIAVYSFPNVLSVGRASWYAYKPGNYAASPDFPKGSRIRVWNRENGRFVDVEINDYGPDRSLFPDRVIDLEKNAFAKIAPLGAGVADIYIEPLFIKSANDIELGVNTALGVGEEPRISAAAAVVMLENSRKIIWAKNATTTLPLASLTKLVAAKVFLDTKPTLNQVVEYSARDEEYNYEHVNKWESASLDLEEGESLMIEDLLYASLVGSANNTVETLVRVSGLKRDDFIARMNSLVMEWGASTTKFIEPTGLAPENVSSALDYAIITREVLRHPIIVKASVMEQYKFTIAGTGESKRVRNTNHIIKQDKYHITGSKTGYLHEAGYCLMTRIPVGNGENIIVVTMGAATRDTSFNETSELMEYGIIKK